MFTKLVCLAALCALLSVAPASGADLGRGWGPSIAWRSLDAAKNEAATSGKPIMVIIHKTWCGACKALKPKVAASEEVAELSKHFVMVNLEDDEEPEEEDYKPDGGYIPRILFLDSEGNVKEEVNNKEGNPKYKYYYTSGENVASGMKHAMEYFKVKTA